MPTKAKTKSAVASPYWSGMGDERDGPAMAMAMDARPLNEMSDRVPMLCNNLLPGLCAVEKPTAVAILLLRQGGYYLLLHNKQRRSRPCAARILWSGRVWIQPKGLQRYFCVA